MGSKTLFNPVCYIIATSCSFFAVYEVKSLRVDKPELRNITHSYWLDLVAQMVEHWTSKPKVVGSIPSVVELAQCEQTHSNISRKSNS